MQILRLNELIDVPWKNGGGTTRDVAKGMRHEQVAWMISRADVAQNGPFSDFTGMKRVLTVVSGGTMTLHTSTTSLEANLWEPVSFDGALKIQSHLQDGPLTALNLKFDPSLCDGHVMIRQGPLDQHLAPPVHGLLALHILSGSPLLNDTSFSAGDTIFVDDLDGALHQNKGDTSLEIRLTYVDQSDAIKLSIANR